MTKYIISLMLILASACSCNSNKQNEVIPVCGGYGNSVKPTAEDMEVWQVAVDSLPQLKEYEVKSVRRQVVAGMNYEFTSCSKDGKVHKVHLFKPLPNEGATRVTYVE